MRIMKNERGFSENFISASRKRFCGNMEAHGHNFFEIEFVISGEGDYIVDGEKHKIKNNTVFFMTPANVHTIEKADMELINVMFRSSGEILPFEQLLRMPSKIELEEGDGAFLLGLLSELVDVYKNDAEYGRLLLKCVCRKLGGYLLPSKEESKPYISCATAYMLENFRCRLSLDDVAKKVGISKAYLSYCFAEQTGTNFSSYLDDLRFSYAVTLLSFTDMSVTDICASSGFDDYSNFLRRFKKRYSLTPLKYRKTHKK